MDFLRNHFFQNEPLVIWIFHGHFCNHNIGDTLLNWASVSSMFWLQENLFLMKEMSKTCSTDQRFIVKEIHTLAPSELLHPKKSAQKGWIGLAGNQVRISEEAKYIVELMELQKKKLDHFTSSFLSQISWFQDLTWLILGDLGIVSELIEKKVCHDWPCSSHREM